MPKKSELTAEEAAIVKEVMGKCGHINRHSKDSRGQFDNCACTKDKGHGGNHGADHLQLIPDTDGDKIYNKQKAALKPVWVEWGEMAGIPVSQIKPIPTPKQAVNQVTDMDDVRSLVGGDIPAGTLVDE